jgi:hypothetical protein
MSVTVVTLPNIAEENRVEDHSATQELSSPELLPSSWLSSSENGDVAPKMKEPLPGHENPSLEPSARHENPSSEQKWPLSLSRPPSQASEPPSSLLP